MNQPVVWILVKKNLSGFFLNSFSESEYFLQKSLEKLMVNRTVLLIAHRLSTVKKADCIVVMNEGKVMEKGSFDDLVALGGKFKDLVTINGLQND